MPVSLVARTRGTPDRSAVPEKHLSRPLRLACFRCCGSLRGANGGSVSMGVALADFQATPELRRWRGEFKGNLAAVSCASCDGYNNALFGLIVTLVRHHEPLARLDMARHRNQPAGSVDRNRASFFVEWIARGSAAVDEYWNMDVDARRSAAIGKPGSSVSGGLRVCEFGEGGFGPPQHREDFPCDAHPGTRWLGNQLWNYYSRFLCGGKTPIQEAECSTTLLQSTRARSCDHFSIDFHSTLMSIRSFSSCPSSISPARFHFSRRHSTGIALAHSFLERCSQ